MSSANAFRFRAPSNGTGAYSSTRRDHFAPHFLRHSLRQTIGAKIYSFRDELGVTKKWVARRAKVCIPTIGRIEKGQMTDEYVTVGSLCRIAKTLGHELVVLRDGEEVIGSASIPLEKLIAQQYIELRFTPIS